MSHDKFMNVVKKDGRVCVIRVTAKINYPTRIFTSQSIHCHGLSHRRDFMSAFDCFQLRYEKIHVQKR